MVDLILNIQKNLTPDLLRGRWKVQQEHPLEGHCYIAAEVLWHSLGKNNYKPICASYSDEKGKCTHWWLVDKKTNNILDPTAEQYHPEKPPYELGRGCGFLTKEPSKRAKIVLNRMR
jgi:hypothetical protein